jgi:Leucyl-tRNA synthetase
MLSDSPPERDLQWTETGIAASFKFINKLYDFIERFKNYNSNNSSDIEIMEKLKIIVNRVAHNIEVFQFNKSVAKIYEFVNILNNSLYENKLSKDDFEWSLRKLSIILQPFVPHISEEIWSCIGNKDLCINENWEEESVGAKTKFKIAIQINGKTREIIEVDDTISKKEVMEIAIKNNKVSKNLSGKTVLREIYVPGKIVNLVTK